MSLLGKRVIGEQGIKGMVIGRKGEMLFIRTDSGKGKVVVQNENRVHLINREEEKEDA